MKKILVIVDHIQEKQAAVEKAIHFAKLTNASVHIAILYYEDLSWLSDDTEDPKVSALRDRMYQHRSHWWENFVQTNSDQVPLSYEVVWEKYGSDWVIEHCHQHHYDLIVKEGHRSESTFHTPTDWQLFRKSPYPVYIVSQVHHEENKVVMVALDLINPTKEKQALNKRLLETAFRHAMATNCEIRVCSAIKFPPIIKELNLIDLQGHAQKIEQQARQACKPILDMYGLEDDHLLIKEGTPWQVIAQLSDQFKAECIVIGCMGRTGLKGKIIGNTAEKVIHTCERDILVLGHQLEEKSAVKTSLEEAYSNGT